MPTKKQTQCERCPALAWGRVCKHCSLADMRSRKAAKKFVNSVGEFNAGVGFSSGLAFHRPVNPTSSDWIGKDREAFHEWYTANQDRMSRGSGAMHRPELLANWTF